jgi:hypothetical protein
MAVGLEDISPITILLLLLLKKLPNLNNRPIGENSPNRVTLVAIRMK